MLAGQVGAETRIHSSSGDVAMVVGESRSEVSMEVDEQRKQEGEWVIVGGKENRFGEQGSKDVV